MGLFSFIGGLLGGGSQKKAADAAARAQVTMGNKAIAEQTRQFDITQANFAPYLTAGKQGLSGLSDLIGMNGGVVQGSAIEALKQSPFYQSLYRNGEEALLQNASATGGLRGGNMQRGLADFGADTLSSTIQQQLANYGGLATMGLGATSDVAGFGQNKANALSQIFGNQGQAQAGAILTKGGIDAQNWKNAGSFLDDSLKMIFGGIG